MMMADSAKQRKKERPQRSPNKIYRTPPTPEPEDLHVRERSFVLDSIAVDTMSRKNRHCQVGEIGSDG